MARASLEKSALPAIIASIVDLGEQGAGRPPYSVSWRHSGIRVYAGKPNTVLIEIEGQGSQALGDKMMLRILSLMWQRVTRIDLAADMICNTEPETFVEYSEAKRIRARGTVVSDTGTTIYVGSKKSNRYMRVYRYSDPHPRSDTLRCELVYRGSYAQEVAQYVARKGVVAAIRAYGDTYGIKHPEWQPDIADVTPEWKPAIRRNQNGTIRWLIAQCAPAFRKCVQEGSIPDAQAFFEEHFLSEV